MMENNCYLKTEPKMKLIEYMFHKNTLNVYSINTYACNTINASYQILNDLCPLF